ncbi:hypothetical protein [Paraburkholderia sp. RL17-337-BIB-A]|uniref:hypothetical protein n=1 Tax=Paraburkholderia sp. RL17-337-BIB-A TaxID=3031636 RepID=UPI0038BC8DFD
MATLFNSTSLHHSLGEIHGDPHLGDVLVFPNAHRVHADRGLVKEGLVSIKVADAGTSEFWSSYDAILRREGALIRETAGGLFAAQNFDKLWWHPRGLPHNVTLQVLDACCSYISWVHGFVDYDRAADNANFFGKSYS